jgi:hypothetical protein
VALSAVLRWTVGSGASQHNAYFGTNAVLGAGDFQGGQSGRTFDPQGLLESGTTYYWRVDEVGEGGTTEGAVWSFTTATDTVPSVLDIAFRDGQVEVRYTGNEVGAAKPYVMMRSTNLLNGGWSPVGTTIPRPASPVVTNLWEQTPPDAGAAFYRLRTE